MIGNTLFNRTLLPEECVHISQTSNILNKELKIIRFSLL